MERVGEMCKVAAVVVLALLHIHVHIHHAFHGPSVDYATLGVAVVASWAGLPGPGEPLLFAAAVLAANGHLDLATVLAVSFVAASAGGIAAWLVGLKFGRALLTHPGPLHKFRLRAMERGDEVFKRYVAVAIFLTPNLFAGIYGVRTSVYLFWNTFWALVWTLGIGLSAYFAGPPVLDVLADLGWISIIGLVVLVAVGVGIELRRRHVRRRVQRPAAG